MADAKERGTKRCPRCGQELFADMEVCYGCLYDFSRERNVGGMPQDYVGSKDTLISEVPWDVGLEPSELHPEDEAATALTGSGSMAPDALPLCIRIQSESVEVTIPLPRDGLLIGRGSVCDVILHSRAVSRHHVRITPRGEGAVVEDCGSTNRATLRGQEVEDTEDMGVGEVLSVCGTLFSLQRGRS